MPTDDTYIVELPAGESQLIVAFVNQDKSSQIEVHRLLQLVATDAAKRERLGWRLVSVGGLPMRQMGTAGNIFFQSGGQYATQVAIVAVYTSPPATLSAEVSG